MAKTTARDKGVPSEYLGDNGKFRPGYDAKYKSALIAIALGTDGTDHDREVAEAQLAKMGWQGHLDKARTVRDARRPSDELLDAVYEHARKPANYEAGWDIIEEATSRDELADLILGATTVAGAIRKASAYVNLKDEQRQEIASTAF